MRYLALLRGINVGGKAKISMAELKTAMATDGFESVSSYINSGNILFESNEHDTLALAARIHELILAHFDLSIDVVVLSSEQWRRVVHEAPDWWGHTEGWKHNLLVLIPPVTMAETISALGLLKPDIERMQAGELVIYQGMSLKLFGRTTTGKLAASPIYKRLTIRNYNTTQKLGALLELPE